MPAVQGILIASFERHGYSLHQQGFACKFGSGLCASLNLAVQPLTRSSLFESIGSTPGPHIDTQEHKETPRAINDRRVGSLIASRTGNLNPQIAVGGTRDENVAFDIYLCGARAGCGAISIARSGQTGKCNGA